MKKVILIGISGSLSLAWGNSGIGPCSYGLSKNGILQYGNDFDNIHGNQYTPDLYNDNFYGGYSYNYNPSLSLITKRDFYTPFSIPQFNQNKDFIHLNYNDRERGLQRNLRGSIGNNGDSDSSNSESGDIYLQRKNIQRGTQRKSFNPKCNNSPIKQIKRNTNIVLGKENKVNGKYNIVSGLKNNVHGHGNSINGEDNAIHGQGNFVGSC